VASAPWNNVKGTIYAFMTYSTSKATQVLAANPDFIYSPLEADSGFSAGKFVGGLALVQIIRYTQTPVGPYDELMIIPGRFEHQVTSIGVDGKAQVDTKKNFKISRIYVSQEETCWNGRKNWNIPKHLAKFSFIQQSNGAMAIKVFPNDKDSTGSATKSLIFSATFKPIPYIPAIPSSTSIAKYIGLDLTFVQPPLPQAHGVMGELVGTDQWCEVLPVESSSKTSLGWWDLKQSGAREEEPLLDQVDQDYEQNSHENWWPGSGRWKIGFRMEDSDIVIPEGRHWEV